MKPLRAVSLSLILGSVGVAGPVLACPKLALQAEDELSRRWPDLTERIQSALAGREGIDTCARVKLAARGTAIQVEVILEDGRSASRSVQRSEDVIPTLEALLFVPRTEALPPEPESELEPEPESESEPQPNQKPPTRRPAIAARPALRWTERERKTPGRVDEYPADRLGIEVALVTGARVGDGQTCVTLGALGLVDVSSALVGLQARANGYSPTVPRDPGESQDTLELAALGGHRTRFGALALDLLAGPAMVFDAGGSNTTGPADGPEPRAEPGVVPRFLLASHLNFATRSVLRGFIGVEGDVGPTSGGDDTPPHLPAWTVGLALGAAIGTR
jgi:hypothetical protein